jgi:large subunit ribosomal protein L4
VLVVLGPQDHAAALSFRNLPEVHLLEAGQLNAYDILVNDWVLFSSASLPGAADAPAKPVKTAKVADAAAAPADGVDEDDKDGES